MTPERRIHGRRILYSPEYLDIGADNGGVVVNLSEGGLGFQTVNPVTPDSHLPISFSLAVGYRIDVKARVVWVNNDGKIGGAAFNKLSKDSQSLIREWMAKQQSEEGIDHEDLGPDAAAQIETGMTADAPQIKVAQPVPEGVTQASKSFANEPAASGIEETEVRDGVVPPTYAPKPAEARPTNPVAADFQRPAAPAPHSTEKKREGENGSSFSVIPSISVWSRKDPSLPTSPASLGLQRNGAPLFPPGRDENIFARPSSGLEPESERKAPGALIVVAIVIAVAALGAFYVRTHRQPIGNAIARIGDSIAGSSAANPSAPAAAAPVNSASSQTTAPLKPNLPPVQNSPAKTQGLNAAQSASIPAAPKQGASSSATPVPPISAGANHASATGQSSAASPNKTLAQTSGKPSSVQIAHNASKNQNAPAAPASSLLAAQSEYQRAEQYLNGTGVTQDYAQAAELFWRSLEAGYTDAALPLANLYLEGNGVSHSCAQARILLDAAAQKNNAQAIHQLAQLPDDCQ